MNIDAWAVVFATLFGPVLAVQAQQWVSRAREKRERQVALFRALMNTRMATMSFEHVSALNSVPLDFRKEKEVLIKWRTYLDHLNRIQPVSEAWGTRRVDLYIELLGEMAKAVGYGEFDPVQLKNEVYAPRGHAQTEMELQEIRQGLVALLKGEKSLPLDVKSIAQDPEMGQRIRELQDLLRGWLKGEVTPKVKVEGQDADERKGVLG